jgi:hypothetical protein
MRDGVVRFTVTGSDVPVTVDCAADLADRLKRHCTNCRAHSAALKVEAAIDAQDGAVSFEPEEEGSLLVVVETWVNIDSDDAPPDVLALHDALLRGLAEV